MQTTAAQIDGTMSVFDNAGGEKQTRRRDEVVRADANVQNGTATIV